MTITFTPQVSPLAIEIFNVGDWMSLPLSYQNHHITPTLVIHYCTLIAYSIVLCLLGT